MDFREATSKVSFTMHVISRTPLRISFFGGGTDYSGYFEREEGAILGTTIDHYTYVSIKTFESAFFDHAIRVSYSKSELVKSVDEIEHPSVRHSLKYEGIDGNLDIHIFSDLPAKTGLGSSSSFTVGFLNALKALRGTKISKQKLAEEACFVEQKLIKENVGSQDQFHASFGGFNVMNFRSDSITVRPLIFPRAKREFLQEHLLVFYTGLTRYASEVVKEQMIKTEKGENDSYLKEMYRLVGEGEKILTHSDGEAMVEGFGKLLHTSWQIKKQLATTISNPFIDEAYGVALESGAFGGKLCGAGSGGFLAFFVPKEKQSAVRGALKPLPEVKFRFEPEGSTIIYMKD